MNARPQVKEILVARKLQRWARIGQCNYIEPSYPRGRARKNYSRLFRRYKEIAARMGLHEFSAYA